MSCRFHATGTYCAHDCRPCDRRMLGRAQVIRSRNTAALARLARTPSHAR